MEKIKLDFCILNHPFDDKKAPIIFVTRNNKDILDETVMDDEEYEKAIFAIQELGYVQSDALTFISSEDPDFPVMDIKTLRRRLEKIGMQYNENLEVSIKNTFEMLKHTSTDVVTENQISEEIPWPYIPSSYFRSLNKPKSRVPDFGERITFYFYLFVEAKFISRSKLFVSFSGDIESKERNNRRQYLRPVKVDFIRVKNQQNPNKILFKSCQTFQDLFKFVPIQNKGSFVYVASENINEIGEKEITSFTLVYDFMEIKNHLKLTERITIESEDNIAFDKLMAASKLVKHEYVSYERKSLLVGQNTINRLTEVAENLEKKMYEYAADEKFEKAALLKKDIAHIKTNIDKMKPFLNQYMRRSQMVKKFHVK